MVECVFSNTQRVSLYFERGRLYLDRHDLRTLDAFGVNICTHVAALNNKMEMSTFKVNFELLIWSFFSIAIVFTHSALFHILSRI